jgi:hypothetical protein
MGGGDKVSSNKLPRIGTRPRAMAIVAAMSSAMITPSLRVLSDVIDDIGEPSNAGGRSADTTAPSVSPSRRSDGDGPGETTKTCAARPR